MKILDSFDDIGSTDFGKVMKLLGKVTEDLPDYLLVLSDMQFNSGSSTSHKSKYFWIIIFFTSFNELLFHIIYLFT